MQANHASGNCFIVSRAHIIVGAQFSLIHLNGTRVTATARRSCKNKSLTRNIDHSLLIFYSSYS